MTRPAGVDRCDRCGHKAETERYGQDALCGACALDNACQMSDDVMAQDADFGGVAVPGRPEYVLGLIFAAARFDPDIRNHHSKMKVQPRPRR